MSQEISNKTRVCNVNHVWECCYIFVHEGGYIQQLTLSLQQIQIFVSSTIKLALLVTSDGLSSTLSVRLHYAMEMGDKHFLSCYRHQFFSDDD